MSPKLAVNINTYLPNNQKEYFLSKQPLRSGTSICDSITHTLDVAIKKNDIYHYRNTRNWCETATEAFGSSVMSNIKEKGECSMMLTGGSTAKQLYKHWIVVKPCGSQQN
jgi:hypothetical protein